MPNWYMPVMLGINVYPDIINANCPIGEVGGGV